MKKAKYLVSGELSEQSMQHTIMDWVRLFPKLSPLVIHTPNEGRRTIGYGRILKDMGVRAGVSDLFIAMAAHGHHGAWIELKTSKGRVSDVQKQFMKDMDEQGYFTVVCRSIEEAIEKIKWYAMI